MTPRSATIPYLLDGKFRRLAYTEWGDPSAEPVICMHGLTRNGRDFDTLARALAARFRVICPDAPGRGRSDWLDEPAHYAVPGYVTAVAHLTASLNRELRWVGTSMGGIMGMMIAAMPGQPITRMVLNDIGPFVPRAALARIQSYIGTLPHFADLAAAEAYLRRVHAPFGALTDAQWRHLAEHSVRPAPAGGLVLHFDPAMTRPILESAPQDMDLSAWWARISIPMLSLRGAQSDLLLETTFAEMGAKSALHTVPACGHAPALMDRPTIDIIAAFLAG